MTERRVFCPDGYSLQQLRADGCVTLGPEEAHYALDVLRLGDGTPVFALDGQGGSLAVTLRHAGKKQAQLVAGEADIVAPPQSRQVHLFMPTAKGERTDWLLEKATELGLTSVTFARFERSVALAHGANKQQRYLRICKSAARQARHGRLPRITQSESLGDALKRDAQRGAATLFAHPAPEAKAIGTAIANTPRVCLVIGPEGGLTPDELRLLQEHDYTAITLGPHILRMETAALVALGACVVTPLAGDATSRE